MTATGLERLSARRATAANDRAAAVAILAAAVAADMDTRGRGGAQYVVAVLLVLCFVDWIDGLASARARAAAAAGS